MISPHATSPPTARCSTTSSTCRARVVDRLQRSRMPCPAVVGAPCAAGGTTTTASTPWWCLGSCKGLRKGCTQRAWGMVHARVLAWARRHTRPAPAHPACVPHYPPHLLGGYTIRCGTTRPSRMLTVRVAPRRACSSSTHTHATHHPQRQGQEADGGRAGEGGGSAHHASAAAVQEAQGWGVFG